MRLVLLLWHLGARWGRVEPSGLRLSLPLTHRLLGQLVAAERPSISHALGRLARAGLLSGETTDLHLHVPKGGTPIYVREFIKAHGFPNEEVSTPAEAAERAARQLDRGADGVKIFAGAIVGGNIGVLPMRLDIAKAIVAEAHRRGLEVRVDAAGSDAGTRECAQGFRADCEPLSRKGAGTPLPVGSRLSLRAANPRHRIRPRMAWPMASDVFSEETCSWNAWGCSSLRRWVAGEHVASLGDRRAGISSPDF